MEKEIAVCNECGSEYYAGSSIMKSICPECAHALYGYPNCSHVFDNGRCMLCYWDGRKSKFVEGLEKPESAGSVEGLENPETPESVEVPGKPEQPAFVPVEESPVPEEAVPAEDAAEPAPETAPAFVPAEVDTTPQCPLLAEAKKLTQAGQHLDALTILRKPEAKEENESAQLLLTLLNSYKVSSTEELLKKTSSSLMAVRTLARGTVLNKLADSLVTANNKLVEHMMKYSLIGLIEAGIPPEKILEQSKSLSVKHNTYESSFSKMDKEDAHTFKRNKALNMHNEDYEFDAFEELDDIRVKFKSAMDHPDKDAGDVLTAGANLALDMLTFGSRFENYHGGGRYDEDSNSMPYVDVKEIDYFDQGIKRKEKPSTDHTVHHGNISAEAIDAATKLPDSSERRQVLQGMLLDYIRDEEKRILDFT